LKFLVDNLFLIAIALISGTMLAWPAIMRRTGGASLSTLAATRLINDSNAVLIDVREPAEFNAGHVNNARNIPMADIAKRAADLPSGKPIIVICANGQRAGRAAAALRSAGRDAVYCLDGGIQAWQQAGLPTVK
jgi:rhodanese-related sulfurtransferase